MSDPNPTACRRSARRARLSLGAIVFAAFALTAPVGALAQAQLPPSLELRVPVAPTVATGDGASFVAYELHITNFSPAPLNLRRVEVVSSITNGSVLLALSDSLLYRALGRPGVSPAPQLAERAVVGAGLRAVVFLWVPVNGTPPPDRLRHRVSVSQRTADSASIHLVEGETVSVKTEVALIGPPLRGGGWLAGNGPGPLTGHRRALIPVDGIPAIAQRFAIDYVKLNDTGSTLAGDRALNENYLAEGVDAIAVADGVVALTKDGIPENVPGINSRAVPITLETVGGNFVIIDIGRDRYAFYAHLKPGSLRVRPGDRIRRGQVLGLVGNSGNSTEPHLHFHLSDGPSPLGSRGLPYAIDTFQVEGRCRRMLAECTRNTAAEFRRREIPMANMIVRFPE